MKYFKNFVLNFFKKIITLQISFALAGIIVFFAISNIAHADTAVSGDITTNTTWTLSNSPYVVTGVVSVRNNAKLTIQPGVTVKFKSRFTLYISNGGYGFLDAQGTPSQPIIFTSASATPAAGDWDGIALFDSRQPGISKIDNVIIEYAGSGSDPALFIADAISLTNSTIRNNKNEGLYISSSSTITNNRIENNGGFAVTTSYRNKEIYPTLKNNTYANNGHDVIKLDTQIYRSTTLTKDTVPYYVDTFLSVVQSQDYPYNNPIPTLRIEPGVTIKLNTGASIYFGSSGKAVIDAQGTADLPIRFTSAAANPAPGDWGQIHFGSKLDTTFSKVDHIVSEFGGRGNISAIYLTAPITILNSIFQKNAAVAVEVAANVTLRNSQFINNIGIPLSLNMYSSSNSSPNLSNNVYLNNGNNVIQLDSSVMNYSVHLTNQGIPYYLPYSSRIEALSATSTTPVLKIDPGVVIKVAPKSSIIISNGSNKAALDARGTAALPIKFTSAAATPAPGDFYTISIQDQTDVSKTFVDNVIVEYGGQGGYSGMNIRAPITVTNSVFRKNKESGILAYVNGVKLTKNKFIDNGRFGIESGLGKSITALSNSFSNNILGGIMGDQTGGVLAAINWWGNASGPAGIGPGTGQAAVGSVVYEPWMGEPYNSSLYFSKVNIAPNKIHQTQTTTTFRTTFNKSANWQIKIKDSNNTVMRTFSGTGTSIDQTWNGDDNNSQSLANGVYSYVIAISDPVTPTVSASLLGRITLDDRIPVAKITAPLPETLIGNQVQIKGSAYGNGFSSYLVEYGIGVNPSQWFPITTSITPVTDGVLANWTIPTLSSPVIRIRLTVKNTQNFVAEDSVIVSVLSIYNVTDYPDPFSPDINQNNKTSTIQANFTKSARYTVIIRNANQAIVRLYTGTDTSLKVVWDGKDQLGTIVPDGIYNYQVSLVYPVGGITAIAPKGIITVDATAPQAQITSPTENETVSGIVSVYGTATDANFDSYQLDFGSGDAPIFSTRLINSTSAVANGLLATWNMQNLSNGKYSLQLTVKDKAGHSTTVIRKLTLDNVQVTDVSATPKFFNPSLSEKTTLAFTLDRAATVKIDLYKSAMLIGGLGSGSYQRNLIGTLTTNFVGKQGLNQYLWNGRDTAGIIYNQGVYTYAISVIDSNSRKGIYDPEYVSGSVATAALSLNPVNFNPFANDAASINYTLAAPAWVTIGAEDSMIFQRYIVEGAPRPAGVNSESWDGRDASGTIYKGQLTLSMKAERMPDVVSVIMDDTLKITSLLTSPYRIIPSYGETTKISYAISRQSDVSVSIISPNGDRWILATYLNQPGGSYSVDWDGNSKNGAMVPVEGNYRVEVVAQDNISKTKVTRFANVTVYK